MLVTTHVNNVRRCLGAMMFLFILYSAQAQSEPDLNRFKTIGDKITAWHEYCNELLANAAYKKLIIASKKGIELSPADSLRSIGMFSLFTGVAYEFDDNFDAAIPYFNETVRIATQIHSDNHLMLALSRLETIYDKQKKTDKRKEVINRMTKLGDSLKTLDIQLLAASAMSGYYSDLGNYDKSIEYRIKDIELLKQKLKLDPSDNGAKLNIGYAYNNLANVLYYTGHPEKSLEYLNEGRPYIGENALKGGEETQYIFYVQAFLGLDNPDSAQYYYKKSYTGMPVNDTVYRVLSTVNKLFGDYYLEKNELEKAIPYAFASKRYALQDNDINTRILSSNLMGRVYFLQKKYKAAIAELTIALQNDFEFDKENEVDIRKKLADSYAHLHMWDSAYTHLEIYSNLKDSLLIQQANENFANAEARYQNKEKAQQISVQKSELSFAKKQRYWLIAGLSMVALVAFILFLFYKNKQRNAAKLSALNDKLAEANQTKAMLFSIIGHDLRSPVNQIYQYLRIQQQPNDVVNETEKMLLVKKVQNATGSLLETMEDLLLWSKTQMDNFSVVKTNVEVNNLVNQCIDLLKLQAEEKNISIVNNTNTSAFVITDENYLLTILRNIVNNAIKAAPEKSQIIIKDNNKILSVENNGSAFSQNDYYDAINDNSVSKGLSGLGLKLIQQLADRINARITFFNPDDNTTVCAIQLDN